MDRPGPSWRSRAPSVSANLTSIEVRCNGPSAPELGDIGFRLLTSGRTSSSYTSSAYLEYTEGHSDRRPDAARRSSTPIASRNPLPRGNCCRFDSCYDNHHGVRRSPDAWIGQGSAEEGSTSRTTQSGMVYAYPRNAQRVAGLRNCTPSAAYAEATKATQEARLVTRKTALAGGEPNTFRIAARFTSSGYLVADSAIDNASRAPSSSARQQRSSQSPTA